MSDYLKFFKDPLWILRVGIAGEFIGHGVFAFSVKQSWLPFFTNLGFSQSFATSVLPLIGLLDFVVALFVLIKPIKAVLVWATIWGFWTALLRPVSGGSGWDFLERFTNWAAPLALLSLQGYPKKLKEWFKV